MSIEPTKLKLHPHQSYSNGFFLLRMPLIINAQPAEISYNDKGMLTLNCRYPNFGITFDSLFNEVSTVVEKYGLSGVTNYWCEDVPLFQLKFSTPDGMKKFISTAEAVQNELASRISTRLAEQQRVLYPDTSKANLPVIVHTEVFLVTPDPINRDADLRVVTAENLSACLSLWRESIVFDFGALFRAYRTKQEKDCGLPTLHQLLANLSDVTEWFLLGIYLDIPESDLEKIRYENHWNVTDCKCEMLSTWLRRNPQPTWATIVTTLTDIGRRSLAYKIALKYGIPTPTLKAKQISTLRFCKRNLQNDDPVQQKICRQVKEIRSGIESKDTELVVKKQTSSGAQNARALAKEKFEQVKQDAVQVQTRVTQLITKRTEMLKLLEQKECGLRTLQRVQEREKGELQSLIDEKNNEIARLKQELEAVQAELAAEKQKASSLQRRLQHATEDLAGKSARVQELEWARQKLETLLDSERKRVDQLLMQQTAASNSQQQYTKEIENQLSAAKQESEAKAREMEVLKQTIALKEGEVKGLHTQLQSQEALLQRLLTQPLQNAEPDPTQELEVEEELKGLTVEVAELRARLVEAEDVKQEAQRQMEVAQLESKLLLELTTELRAARQPPTVKPKPTVRQPPTVKPKPTVRQPPTVKPKPTVRQPPTIGPKPGVRQQSSVKPTNTPLGDLESSQQACVYQNGLQVGLGQRGKDSHIGLESSQQVYQNVAQVYQNVAQVLPSEQEDVYDEVPRMSIDDISPFPSPSTKAAEKKTNAAYQCRQAEGRQEVWAPGTEVIGKHEFIGSMPHDLSFTRGDSLTIISKTKDKNWYKAKRYDGLEGIIPHNFVVRVEDTLARTASTTASSATHTGPRQATDGPRPAVKLQAMPWFHGDISRESAEQLLKPFKDGNFLVRESPNYKGDYTLCVSFRTGVEHYRVRREQHNWVTIDDVEYFENLVKLVEHYQRDADGLCCRLKHSIKKTSGDIEYAVSMQDFKEGGWAIPMKSLNKKKVIGNGEFKVVCLGEYQGQKVAMTTIKERKASQQLLVEAAIMTALRHPNLVSLIGVCLDEPPIYLITEYMAKGSLLGYLASRGRACISKLNQLNFAKDICKGMVYMEAHTFLHRNLAARNVLIGNDNTAKVSDFHLAQDVILKEKNGERLMVKWTAPEALRDEKFSNKSDVWSFGILLWEIYSYGRAPYPRVPVKEVVHHIDRGYRMDAPGGCPDDIYRVMKECWDKNASHRPNFSRIENILESISVL